MSELMSEGLYLALYGMGTVFFFLTLLVAATLSMSALVPSVVVQESEGLDQAGHDPKIKAAIRAAIHQHRQRNQSRNNE